MTNGMKIFGGSSGQAFTQKMCRYLGIEQGQSDVITFSEGNTFVRIKETVRGEDIYLVQPIGTRPNDELVEILFWMDAFKRASANSVTAVIPYFGYAKGDKKDEPRVSIRARVCAECLELAGADRVVTMDLHSPQVQGFFKKPLDNLYALPVLGAYIDSLGLENYVVVSPDAGYARQARAYSQYLNVPAVIGDKTRMDHTENAEILEIIGDVKDRDAVIVDDFTISGGTLLNLAHTLKEKGARRIYACVSHLLLNHRGMQRLEESNIECLISTDTVSNPLVKESSKVRIVSAAPLFAEALRQIHLEQSISPLFEKLPDKLLEACFSLSCE